MENISVPKTVSRLLARLMENGYTAYAVGGCVRDLLMNKQPTDYDVCTSARPDEISRAFSDCKTVPTGIKHGTVTVLWEGVPYEITTFRLDCDYEDHRHPSSVVFSDNVEDDLARRDFTVNAMCYNEKSGLVDIYGGVADIESKRLKCVGDAGRRFTEDALRILRCLRFSARLGFEIEKATEMAMYECLPFITRLSAERILSELKGILTAEQKCATVERYFDILLSAMSLSKSKTDKSTVVNALRLMPPSFGFAAFCALVCESVEHSLKKLKSDTATLKQCLCAERGFKDIPSVAEAVREYGVDTAKNTLKLCKIIGKPCPEKAAELIRKMADGTAPMSAKELAVKGNELMQIGFSGKALGEIQSLLLKKVYEGLPNEKAILITEAKKRKEKL